nr:MAG TPA: hypothetical protein [Caudoviricetes sp.]
MPRLETLLYQAIQLRFWLVWHRGTKNTAYIGRACVYAETRGEVYTKKFFL